MTIQKLDTPRIGDLYGSGASRAPVIEITNGHIITEKSRPIDDEKLYFAYRVGQTWHGKPSPKYVNANKAVMDEWVRTRKPRS